MANICLYLIASNNLKLQHLPSSISPPPSFLDTPLLWAFELLKISLLKFPHTKEKIVVKNTPPYVFVEGKIRDHDFLHNQDLVVLLMSHSLMKVNYLPFKNTSIFSPLMPECVGVLVNPVKERSVYVFVYNCSSHFSRLKERKRRAYLSCPNFLIKEFE